MSKIRDSRWNACFYWGIGLAFGFDPHNGFVLVLPFVAFTYTTD